MKKKALGRKSWGFFIYRHLFDNQVPYEALLDALYRNVNGCCCRTAFY
jgi:hypothetical protein